MHVENLKLWQWMVLGVLLGTGVGSIWGSYEFEPDFRIAQAEFEGMLGAKGPDGQPILKDIVLRAPTTDVNNKPIQCVTGQWLRGVTSKSEPGKINSFVYKTFEYYAPVAYVPYDPMARFRNAAQKPPTTTPREFLDGRVQADPSVSYVLESPNAGKLTLAYYAGGGFVLMGLIWPMTIKLMVSAGLVPPPSVEKEKDEYDLSRFGRKSEPAKMPVSLKPVTSDADKQKLNELTSDMERKLADFGANDPATVLLPADENAPGRIDTRKGAEPIKTLNTTPVEPVATPEESGHPKDYQGEFYPVVRGKG